MEKELLFKIFIGKKDQNKIIVFESQLNDELIDLLVTQLKDAGFFIPEYKELNLKRRGSCYLFEISALDPELDQAIVFYEYKFTQSI